MNSNSKERPIILNSNEINSILSGTKTQHRMPIKHLEDLKVTEGFYSNGESFASLSVNFSKVVKSKRGVFTGGPFTKQDLLRWFAHDFCPFGKVGDRLWVRETHHVPDFLHDYEQKELAEGLITRDDLGMSYKADAPHMTPADGGWTSPVAMPRWASRLLLKITDIRIERILDISDTDARAMGLKPDYCDHKYQRCEDIGCIGKWAEPLMNYFIHEKNIANVSSHDWVWVIEFKKVDD